MAETTLTGTDVYNSANYPGGGLAYYTSAGQPYPGLATASRPRSSGGSSIGTDMLKAGLTGGVSSLVDLAQGKLPFQSLFGGSDKPKAPYWKRLANKEWAQANAALSTQYQMYEPTLRLNQRAAADYGDLYRRASNDALAHEILTATTKRNADFGDFQRLGPEYVAALRQNNPLLAALYDRAQADFALGDQLNPFQQRQVQQAVRAGQSARGLGLGPVDVYEEALRTGEFGQQLQQQRFQQAGAAQGLYGDIFQATVGRPALAPAPQGANINAPNNNIGIEDYLSMGINFQTQDQNAAAAKRAQQMQLIGAGIGAIGQIGGSAAMFCWVAREVYGENNAKWRQFRQWMVEKGDSALKLWYLFNGAQFALWLRHNPEHKPALREWMDAKLATVG